jgi:hypothetical protein
MNEYTLKIDKIEYTIDLEKAKSLGLLKPVGIKKFRTGDAYKMYSGNIIVIVPTGYTTLFGDQPTWSLAGINGTLEVYSSFGKEGATEAQMLQWLNSQKDICFIRNINNEFKNLLSNLVTKGK